MPFEQEPATISGEPGEEEPDSIAILDTMRLQASEDNRLSETYEEIIDLIDNYVVAKMRHTQYAERNQVRIQLDERYQQRFDKMEDSRYDAHNKLISSLTAFARRARKLKLDTSWFDGPNGIATDRDNRTARQHIDDWAMDIWLDQENKAAA